MIYDFIDRFSKTIKLKIIIIIIIIIIWLCC